MFTKVLILHKQKNKTMKKSIKNLATLVIVAFMTFSFTIIDGDKKEIKLESSKVVWKGYKVTGSHEGIISIKSGHLNFDKDILIGGNFEIDMSTITVTDLEGEYKGKLEGHLKSDDFFGVANHPEAKIIITTASKKSGNTYGIVGDLTIKGITNPVTFDMVYNGKSANANLIIDRTKYNVRYGSGSFFDNLGDKTIYDEFKIAVELKF